MAIEILLEKGKTFYHHLRHDLESVLFVIIWICSHLEGPEVERKDVANLAVRKWSNMELGLRDLGHLKLAHIEDAKRTLLPEFTSYWEDFKPFILKLIQAFFPTRASEPNSIDPDTMVSILEEAEMVVKEPSESSPRSSVEPADVETEMHEYNVLKYGKNHRRGQEEAPRKRIRTEPSSPPRTRSSSARTRSSRISFPSRSIPRSSKLRNTTSRESFEETV
jgi:Fungal protein kinase